jgi:peptidyl-prolyl cis-trans isomerase D
MLGYLRSGNKRTKLIWWLVTIATVFTFLIGFSFFGGLGQDSNWAARQAGVYGSVNGEKVTKDMWQSALDTERERYRQRFGTDPVDRDLQAVQQQAWRNLVNTRLLVQAGLKAGFRVTDNDVLATMQIDPPMVILAAPAFQTDGKFDPAKYSAALRNPQNDWSTFESQVRAEAPGKKLQEVVLTSVKFSDAELRESFTDRFNRLSAIVVAIPPADTGRSAGTDADLQRVYDKYRHLLATPARTQLEYLSIPVQFGADEIKTASDVASGIYQRALKGESFDQLCRDYSEGLNADHGGVIDRFINPAEMGPAGQQIMAHKPGDVLEPMREGGTIMIFRILDPARDTLARNAPAGTVKLAQITVKVRPAPESVRTQYERAAELAKRAKQVGLSKAATEKGLATAKTGFYDLQNTPQQLYSMPEAADWGLTHPKGALSPVFQNPEEFMIVQVAIQQPAGIPARADVAEELKQIADFDARVELSKARSDQVAAALRSGATLEAAAAAAGLSATPVTLSHDQPDPRIGRAPELQGALWAAKPGQVVGPIRSPVGYFYGRVVGVSTAPDSLWNNQQMRSQMTSDVINRRQQSVLNGLLGVLRKGAKIEDTRGAYGQ